MKKIVKSGALAGLLLLTLLVLPAAATEAEGCPIRVLLDGEALAFDVAPATVNGRTLVPFRTIFETLGYTVEWDGGTGIRAARDTDRVELTIGGREMKMNGAAQSLDVSPMAVNGRTLVPLRAVAEASDCDVFWDGAESTVLIYRRRGALETGEPLGGTGFCTDGESIYCAYWAGDSEHRSLRIDGSGKAEQFPQLPAANDYQYYKGKVYGRMGTGETSELSYDVYDPATGETTCLLDGDVGAAQVWEDHIYFTPLSYVDEDSGFYRSELDGSGIVYLGDTLKYDFVLADGMAFSDQGEIRSLETGETLGTLEDGDFLTAGTAVANGKYYIVMNRYDSERETLTPLGILCYDYGTGEEKLLELPWVMGSIAVTRNSLLVTAEAEEGWQIYRLTLEGTHPILLAEIRDGTDYGYLRDITAIGNYLYYERGGYHGREKESFVSRIPLSGGAEEILWRATDPVEAYG